MTTTEKVAYLKGLCEGMGMDESSREGKLFQVIGDILADLAADVEDTKDSLEDLTDCMDEISEDLSDLEDEFYDELCGDCDECDGCGGCGDEDEDEDEPVFYRVKCPGCDFALTVDEDTLSNGSFECPECGEVIDFRSAEVEELDFEDEDN